MPPRDLHERRLSEWCAMYNRRIFGGALLVPPTIMLADTTTMLGEWTPHVRTIRFSRRFVEASPWLGVAEILKHEMAHQYVSDVLGVDDETPHGPAFRMVCGRYGIDSRATAPHYTSEQDKKLDMIRKLLALGSSPNEHEAKAALRKAVELMDLHGLSGEAVQSEPHDFGAMQLGGFVVQPMEHHHVVATVLSECFRVRCIWVQTFDQDGRLGMQLEVVGRSGDLEVANHVHDFLHHEAERLWQQTAATKRARQRAEFLTGVMRGFQQAMTERESHAGQGTDARHASLVRIGRDVDLDDFFARRHPETSRLRKGRQRFGSAFIEGFEAGQHIELRKPVPGKAGPKLLGG